MTFEGRNLICIRGNRLIFEKINFTVESGAALWLKGPNGSGKSTLLRMLAGLIQPTSGQITWNDQDIKLNREDHRARVIYTGHLDATKAALTVSENLTFWAAFNRPNDIPIQKTIDTALERLHLTPLSDVPVRLLSAGERRRTNLARLVINPAPLWLLDEPTSSLDETGIANFTDLIIEHLARGGITFIATHMDMEVGEFPSLGLGKINFPDLT